MYNIIQNGRLRYAKMYSMYYDLINNCLGNSESLGTRRVTVRTYPLLAATGIEARTT